MPSWDHRDPGRRTSQAGLVLTVCALVLMVVALLVGTAKAEGDRSRGEVASRVTSREALRTRSGVAATPSGMTLCGPSEDADGRPSVSATEGMEP